jgi:DNA uptake protein ComE-like DNA-binding protein
MKRLGLESKLIRTIINYRNHGGRFFKPSDLNKIYGMNSLIYDRIEPYISIPHSEFPSVPENKIRMTGINTADSTQLVRVSGIGPVLAGRILRYRQLIGGFYDLGQLKEVYGLRDSVISKIDERFFADTANIIRLNINTASEQELARHPYIGRYASKGIVKYRTSVPKIIKTEELVANGILTEDQWKKVRHYMSL